MLRELAPTHPGPFVLSHLGDKLKAPTSDWHGKHTTAFRLIAPENSSHRSLLPSLKVIHEQSCPICYPSKTSSQNINTQVIKRLRFERSEVPNFRTSNDSSLLNHPEGSFWLPLAKLLRSDLADPAREYPSRERRTTRHPGYVDSAAAIPGSSSPRRPPSSAYSGSNASFPLDDDQNENRAQKPEPLVVDLTQSLFRLCLHSCLNQTNPTTQYSSRLQSHVSKPLIAGANVVVGADDGGICGMRLKSSSWINTHNVLVMSECKRAFQNLHFDDGTQKYTPILTPKALAQLFGEAVLAWKENASLVEDGIYSTVTSGTYIRLFHFTFGDRYAQYLEAEDEKNQLDLVQRYPDDTCAYVSSTRWFDLDDPGDTITTICLLLARLRLYETGIGQGLPADQFDADTVEPMDTSYSDEDSECASEM
ncbi:hypothetical protein HC256_004120 [Beauveria bassiana]|nr:hypothetical protein HC256_004120 [Beauveria bassiana]